MEIYEVMLTFKNGLLQKITVKIKGRANAAGFNAAIIEAYGQPKPTSYGNEWEGERVSLHTSQSHDDWLVAFFESKEVEAKIKADVEQKAKAHAAEAAKQL